MVMVPAMQLLQLVFCNLTLNLFVQTCYISNETDTLSKQSGESSGGVSPRHRKREGLTELFLKKASLSCSLSTSIE